MLKKIFCSLLISQFCGIVFAADITGDYKCSIYDPKKNSHYNENINIASTGETYRLQYYPPNSSMSYILGTGLVTGDALAVVNWEPSSNWVGVTLFAIKPDGSLDGTWATIDKNLVGTETCSKI